jgi:hypothetical protein
MFTPEQIAAGTTALGLPLTLEYSVPCMDGQSACRKIFGSDRSQAEACAKNERSLVEVRLTTGWIKLPD